MEIDLIKIAFLGNKPDQTYFYVRKFRRIRKKSKNY